MMGSSSPAQQAALESILMVVTNPALVEKNIRALQESMAANDEKIARAENAKGEAATQLAAALAAEQALKPKQAQIQSDFDELQKTRSALVEDHREFETMVSRAKAELMDGRDKLAKDVAEFNINVDNHSKNVRRLQEWENSLAERSARLEADEDLIAKRMGEVGEMKAELQEKLESISAIAGKKK